MSNRLSLATKEIVDGLKCWRIWLLLGWQDIRLRYRRSHLGPFWITISTGTMIYGIGFLYGGLFHMELSHYFPYLASGMLGWTLISATVMESNEVFAEAAPYIKQIRLPYTVYILRVLTRNFIIFLHNILVLIPILLYYHISFSLWQASMILYALFIIWICGFSYGIVFGMFGVRFQDIKQVINSLIQLVFLLTPIMWMPTMLPEKYKFAVNFNPFYQIISLLRDPFIGQFPSNYTLLASLFIALTGIFLMFFLLYKARHRIAFWT